MKTRRRPNDKVQRSLSEPQTGVRKKPNRGDKLNTIDIKFACTPISSKIGLENAVMAEYVNSMPAITALILSNSHLLFRLEMIRNSVNKLSTKTVQNEIFLLVNVTKIVINVRFILIRLDTPSTNAVHKLLVKIAVVFLPIRVTLFDIVSYGVQAADRTLVLV